MAADAIAIAAAAVAAAAPGRAVTRALRRVPHGVEIAGNRIEVAPQNLCVIAVGKAAGTMAWAAVESLRDLAPRGLVVIPPGERPGPPELDTAYGEHPLPGPNSRRAAQRVERLLSAAGPQDLVLLLISGGASSLLGDWPDSLPDAAVARTTGLMLGSGMPIGEMNLVRQQLATLKAGRAVIRARPARVAALLISDVVGSDPSIIGSGLSVGAAGTPARALEVLERRGLLATVPGSVRGALADPQGFALPPAPARDDPRLATVVQRIIVDNQGAVLGARAWAEHLGYAVHTLRRPVVGEARDAGGRLGRLLRRVAGTPATAPRCLLGGGETVVTLQGGGVGGRNQELAAAAALELDGIEGVCLCSIGTDGVDGPTPAAGAIVDGSSRSRARDLGMTIEAALARNDSYRLFEALDDLLVTGPTGTNVMDIQVLLIGAR